MPSALLPCRAPSVPQGNGVDLQCDLLFPVETSKRQASLNRISPSSFERRHGAIPSPRKRTHGVSDYRPTTHGQRLCTQDNNSTMHVKCSCVQCLCIYNLASSPYQAKARTSSLNSHPPPRIQLSLPDASHSSTMSSPCHYSRECEWLCNREQF